MPYRVRAFCIKNNIPALDKVFDYAMSRGIKLIPDETHGPIDVSSKDWSDAEISYKDGKSPLVVECNRDDGKADCLARVEPQEYIEEIEQLEKSSEASRVIKHLKNTKFIIASQLLNDIDEDGYVANGVFLEYFVQNCGGIIHADLEGFYDGANIILEVG